MTVCFLEDSSKSSNEAHLDARVVGQPVGDLDAFVGGVVIHHRMPLVGVGVRSALEDLEEFLVPMAVLADGATRSMTKTRDVSRQRLFGLSRLQSRGTGIDCDMIASRSGRSVAAGPCECGVGFSGIRWTT
jgi:hypothetical protein